VRGDGVEQVGLAWSHGALDAAKQLRFQLQRADPRDHLLADQDVAGLDDHSYVVVFGKGEVGDRFLGNA